jgi:hypothetical protein
MNDQYERETTEKYKRNHTNDNDRNNKRPCAKDEGLERTNEPLQMTMAEKYKRPFTNDE